MSAAGARLERLPSVGGLPFPAALALVLLLLASALAVSRAPALMIGFVLGVAFIAVLLSNLLAGVIAFIALQFLATVPGLEAAPSSMIRVAGAILALGWLVTLTDPNRRNAVRSITVRHPWAAAAMVAFLIWGLVSITWATAGDLVWADIQRYLLNFVLLGIVFTAIRSLKSFTLVAGALALAGAVAAAAAILLFEGSGRLEGGGSFGANEFAAGLVPVAILAVALSWTAETKGRRIIFGAAAAVAVAGIVLSLSRGGFIALPVAFAVWAAFGGRWRFRIMGMLTMAGAIAVAVFMLAAPPEERDRVFETEGGGSGRSDLWSVAFRLWQDAPLQGIGLGNFPELAPLKLQEATEIERGDLIVEGIHAHSTYLGILAETGIVGFVFFAVIVVAALMASARAALLFQRAGNVKGETLARALFAGTIGLLVGAAFIYIQFQRPLWILLGMSLALYGIAQTDDDGDRTTPRTVAASVRRRLSGQ
ncbi:MAG: O-antigen ligase family protein [Miltoncostaeaceae bacterium]